ncbi:MAG: dihydroorotate dehydrogenase electron transfer subunit, partial [Candidatus Omnitrophica bacterium]|nr:dihydroorotate dehydrogenase electron transfer subunit [Candidatus Omnitrophota bacterium]
MIQTRAKVIKNIEVASKYCKILLRAPAIARQAKPGQFVNIKVSDGVEPLLRRPLSIHRVLGQNIEVLFEVVGKGTEIIAQRKVGEFLDIIGPLGNGFSVSALTGLPILVAGGMGVAALVFLAEQLTPTPPHPHTPTPIVLIGAKTKSHILCEKEFKKLGCEIKIATEDASKGFKGKITDLLKKFLLTTCNLELRTIYSCGPKPMLKEIAEISKKHNIPAQVSLEEH